MKYGYAWVVGGASALLVAGFFLGRANAPLAVTATAKVENRIAARIDEPRARKPPASAGRRSAAATVGDPLPALDTPLKDAFTELQARANAGDAAAATRLVRDLDHCRNLRGSESINARAADELAARKTDGMRADQLRTYQALLEAMELRQQAVAKAQALCDGVDQAMLDTLTPNIAQAAALGDAGARACYLALGPTVDAHAMLDHPEYLAAYRDNARSMIDGAIAGGDWRAVDLLQAAYQPGAQSLLAGLVGSDAIEHYRYLKLYRLGAEAFRAASLDAALAAAAANLTPADVADADAWAQTTLQQHFSGDSTAATPQGWDACDFAAH